MKRALFAGGTESARRRTIEGDLDITPMIDVTFLLLIFFMVTSTMQSTPDLDLPAAKHGLGIPSNQQIVISILNQGGAPQLIAGDPPGPELTLPEILEYARNEMQAGKTGILLKASGQTPTGLIRQIARELQSVGDVQFYFGVSDQK